MFRGNILEWTENSLGARKLLSLIYDVAFTV